MTARKKSERPARHEPVYRAARYQRIRIVVLILCFVVAVLLALVFS